MKRISKLLSIVAVLTFLNINQISAQMDKVYLHNDTRLVGKLVYYKPGDSVKIELKNGQLLAYPDKAVKKVVMGETATPKVEKPYEFRERGLYNITYLNTAFGKATDADAIMGFGLQNITGYQFNRWIGAGLGIGFDNFYTSGNDANVLAIFPEVRGYLSRDNRAFYYSLAGGYGLPFKEKGDSDNNLTGHRGGFMVQPALGLRLGASSKFNFFVDIGAKIQQVRYDQIYEWRENHFTVTYKRWVLRGGIMF